MGTFKKRIFVLGAGKYQVPLIEKCRAMDCEVLVASIPGPYPGFDIADRAYPVDVRDKETLLRIAREQEIDAILTDQTDIPVATAAWVADQLGLPGIGVDCALRFTNKKLMQQVCLTLGITTLSSHVTDSLDALTVSARNIGYPVVVKPVDNQGSRGVSRVDKKEEIEAAFREAHRYTSTGEILVEKLFVGREIVIEGFSLDGTYTNLIIGDRTYFDIPGRFIPQATLFPTNLSHELKDQLLNINNRLVTGFGLPFGITHSEYLVNEQTGEIRLIEVAARGGGVFISSDLIPLCCGLDVNKLLIQRSLGTSVVVDYTSTMEVAASGYICFTLPEGVIDQPPNIEEIENIVGVYRACLEDLDSGKKIHRTMDKTMRQGPILIRAESREGLDKIHKRVQQALSITISTPDGVRGPIWC